MHLVPQPPVATGTLYHPSPLPVNQCSFVAVNLYMSLVTVSEPNDDAQLDSKSVNPNSPSGEASIATTSSIS